MKLLAPIFISSALLLQASTDFPYIKPLSVEVQTIKRAIEPKQEVIIEQEPITQKEVVPQEQPQEEEKKEETLQAPAIIEVLDEDKDGIEDSLDKCPNTALGFRVDKRGCPQTATINVTFRPDKHDITSSMTEEITKFANFLKENTGYQVLIYGYTDSIGDDETNKILSQKRADAIKSALIGYGVSSTKLTAIGRGEENPIESNMYKSGREKNRRIEVELIE